MLFSVAGASHWWLYTFNYNEIVPHLLISITTVASSYCVAGVEHFTESSIGPALF